MKKIINRLADRLKVQPEYLLELLNKKPLAEMEKETCLIYGVNSLKNRNQKKTHVQARAKFVESARLERYSYRAIAEYLGMDHKSIRYYLMERKPKAVIPTKKPLGDIALSACKKHRIKIEQLKFNSPLECYRNGMRKRRRYSDARRTFCLMARQEKYKIKDIAEFLGLGLRSIDRYIYQPKKEAPPVRIKGEYSNQGYLYLLDKYS